MKEQKTFNTIQPNANIGFEVVYYHVSKVLKKLEMPLIKADCNDRTIASLDVIQKKIEQMVSKYKADKLVFEKAKRKEVKRKKQEKEARKLEKV